ELTLDIQAVVYDGGRGQGVLYDVFGFGSGKRRICGRQGVCGAQIRTDTRPVAIETVGGVELVIAGTSFPLIHLVEIGSESEPDRGFAASGRIPSKAEPGSKIHLRGMKRQTDGAGRIRDVDQGSTQAIHFSEVGKKFVAQAQVQSQPGSHLPVVMNKPGGKPLPPSKLGHADGADGR